MLNDVTTSPHIDFYYSLHSPLKTFYIFYDFKMNFGENYISTVSSIPVGTENEPEVNCKSAVNQL